MADRLADRYSWLAPMIVWPLARPLIPPQPSRQQGGGARRADDEAMFAAIAFVLASGSPWRGLPGTFGVSWQTAHRRFGAWTRIELFARVHEVAGAVGSAEVSHWARRLAQAAAERGGEAPVAAAPPPGLVRPAGTGRTAIRRYLPPELVERVFGRRTR